MGVCAPLTKYASFCLSNEVSLLSLPNPFAFQQHEVIIISAIQFNGCENLHDDFRAILNKGESLSAAQSAYEFKRLSRFFFMIAFIK